VLRRNTRTKDSNISFDKNWSLNIGDQGATVGGLYINVLKSDVNHFVITGYLQKTVP
jgi:hypothetical protein